MKYRHNYKNKRILNCLEGGWNSRVSTNSGILAGADPGFKVRGGTLKKLHRAEAGANIFAVFRVKNHDFMPKNHIFSNFRRGGGVRWVHPPPLTCGYKTTLMHVQLDSNGNLHFNLQIKNGYSVMVPRANL